MFDIRPDIGVPFDLLGVPASVKVPTPGSLWVSTVVVWLGPVVDTAPYGEEGPRVEPRRRLALRRADIPAAPKGTRVRASETLGGPSAVWHVDGLAQPAEADELRVFVSQVRE